VKKIIRNGLKEQRMQLHNKRNYGDTSTLKQNSDETDDDFEPLNIKNVIMSLYQRLYR